MGTPRRTAWPVGQVVKTAASHAVNIGSNPVRVTISKKAMLCREPLADTKVLGRKLNSLLLLVSLLNRKMLERFATRAQKSLDK